MESPGNILKFGNFEILKHEDGTNIELGRGSYGVTYKANHRYLRKIVALKVIHDRHMENAEATQRFLTEAQIVASLDHRNIARVFDFGEHDGIFFYAMEFCDGGSLEDLANRKGPLSWPAIIPLARQIAEALECAHSAGLLHRDIKPSNLMLVGESDPPVVKLIDFGLVKVLESAEKSSTFQMLSRDGGFIGNPMSAAPEQLLEETIDARADLFSLGITLWYLLLAKSPFEGTASAKLVHERLSDSPYDLGGIPGLDAHGRAILARLVAKDPEARFSSAGELIQALDDPAYGRGESTAPEPPVVKATPVPVPEVAAGPPGFDGFRIIRRLSSNSQGVAAVVDHPRGASLLVAHAEIARVVANPEHGSPEWGTYGGEPALLFHGITAATWDGVYSLAEEPTKHELLSWFGQIARVADLFRAAGFSEIDFRPSSVLPLGNPLQAPGGQSHWLVAPRFEDATGNQDAWNSIGGESLAPTSLSAFVALIYRSLAGMRLKPASFIKESAYVKSPNLTESGNNLIASTLSAPPEAVARTGYMDFVLELARHEQTGVVELSPLPTALLSSLAVSGPPPALPVQAAAPAPQPVAQASSSTPPPPMPAAASTPPSLPPAPAAARVPDPAPPPAPASTPAPAPQPATVVPPAAPQKPASGKSIKLIAAAAAVILLAAAASLAIIFKPGEDKPVANGGNTTPVIPDPPPRPPDPPPIVEPPVVEPPAASYDQVDLANAAWLVPGAEFTLVDRDGIIVVNKTTIDESAARIFKLNGSFNDAQWKRSAPYRMEVAYRAADVCDMKVSIEGIAEARFAAVAETPNRLSLSPGDLVAAVKGWFAPRFVPVIENDTSGINDGAPLAFSDGDPIKTAIQYPAGTETRTAGMEFENGRFEFELQGATGAPQWVVSSSLFSKDVTLPLQPPFTTAKIPLSTVEVTADPRQIGVLVDGLVLKPLHEAKSPLWQRIGGFTPVITAQNPKARIVKAEDYAVVILGGPLDGLAIAKVNASAPSKIELPTFQTGYAFGLNPQTPYEVEGRSDPRDAAYLLTMPKDEPWRAVIVCYDKGLNDGAGGFHITENIMRAKSYDPATKRVRFELDYMGAPYRIVTVNLRNVFQSASLEFPAKWNAAGAGFSFPATAVTKGRDGKEYTHEIVNKGGFAATQDPQQFVNAMQGYFVNWIITEAAKDEVQLTPELVREKTKIPDENDMLGKNIFDTNAFKARNQ